MDWGFRTKCSPKSSGIYKSWTESWQASCVLFSSDVMHRLWRFIKPSRTANRLIFSLLLSPGTVSVSFVPPLIPSGSSKLHPLPLPPKKAICDAVRQQIQRETHTAVGRCGLTCSRGATGQGPLRVTAGAEARMSEEKGESSTVFKTPCFASFFTKLSFLYGVCSP